MLQRRYFVLVAALVIACSSSSLGQTIPRDIRLKILEAVVQIIPYDAATGETAPWSGSGTIISPDGYILTNYHVIGDLDTRTHHEWHAVLTTDPAFTDQPPQFAYWARAIASDPTHDLAILRIEEYADETPVPAGTAFPAVAVGDSNKMLPGDPIVIVGYPGISGSTVTFTSGTMSGWVGEDFEAGGKQWIKTDAKIAHGNSGGAAFDLDGNLIGVPTAGRTIQYDELDVEEQAYVRPIGLAWAVIGPNVANVLRAAAPSPGAAPAQQAADARPAATQSPAAADASGTGDPSGEYGDIALGTPRSGRLAAASDEGFTFHGYSIPVPVGTTRVVVSVDGRGNDVDLAVSNGSPITDYEVVEHLDVTEEPNPTYAIDAPADVVYVDVLNLFESPIDYTLVVSADTDAAANPLAQQPEAPSTAQGANPLAPQTGNPLTPAPTQPSASIAAPFRTAGTVSALAIGQSATGALDGIDGTAPFHTYWVDVPAGTARLVVRMSADQDLDLAAKVGAEIDTYTEDGNWDWIDTTTSTAAEFVIPNPVGRIYIDVFNALGAGVTGSYTLTVQ